tara:strand:+ start:1025 stop:1225 length:201 start_codon:yes stop_codon:yes gene_type:complete
MVVFAVIMPLLFVGGHIDFFKQAHKEILDGAKWHYVGYTPIDSTAKSIPLENTITSEKHIIWKLKK